eukprot:8805506-Heterocapsa_arctica.AAC.1
MRRLRLWGVPGLISVPLGGLMKLWKSILLLRAATHSSHECGWKREVHGTTRSSFRNVRAV